MIQLPAEKEKMAAQRIGNSNMVKLEKGERVSGAGGEVEGPAIVRVHTFGGQINAVRVQAGEKEIEIEGIATVDGFGEKG